ncbi:hypothetical protein WM41_1737 [Corynebacterium simulans]|uniref:Uncharacterized protein n=1 Tax=Corynebacterium simulans TaxID=146827 RepID=A0ABR5V9I3_9CORY|nr:hypothetical protein WM41_1737 [Corynebacterium simulans]
MIAPVPIVTPDSIRTPSPILTSCPTMTRRLGFSAAQRMVELTAGHEKNAEVEGSLES